MMTTKTTRTKRTRAPKFKNGNYTIIVSGVHRSPKWLVCFLSPIIGPIPGNVISSSTLEIHLPNAQRSSTAETSVMGRRRSRLTDLACKTETETEHLRRSRFPPQPALRTPALVKLHNLLDSAFLFNLPSAIPTAHPSAKQLNRIIEG